MCLRAITPVLLLSLLFSTQDSRAENIYAVLTQNLTLANSSASEIEIFDGDSYTLVNSFSIGTRSPTSIAVTPDQSQIFVADYTNNEIAVYAPNGFLLDTIAVTTPTDMALSPDGVHLYVSSGTSVIDFSTVTHGMIGSAGLSSDFANGISLSPDRKVKIFSRSTSAPPDVNTGWPLHFKQKLYGGRGRDGNHFVRLFFAGVGCVLITTLESDTVPGHQVPSQLHE